MAKDRVDVLEGQVAVLRWQLDAVMRAVADENDFIRRELQRLTATRVPAEVARATDFVTRERTRIEQRIQRRARRL